MKALVTGGAGFIGSTLVDRLLADGHDVVVVDNLASGLLTNLDDALAAHGDKLTFYETDIRSPEAESLIKTEQPEIVVHLAAQIDVRLSVIEPKYDADVNIMGALNVLEAARDAGARKFLFASSGGTIYGTVGDEDLPVDESHSRIPISPYGISKNVVGDYLRTYADMWDIETTALALANVYGPRQNPHGEAGVVSIFTDRLLRGEECTIYGDGEATRDFVFVEDVADAFVKAATEGKGLYNIGTGVETSTKLTYSTIAKAVGFDGDALHAPERRAEIRRSSLNSTKARAELGWSPQFTFEQGAQRVVDYFRPRIQPR